MDNLCHTLTGAVLAEAGLKHRTRFASAALMIAANLPDLDVLAFATGTPPVALRRGWTHGVLAQALLPVALTAAFVAVDRWRPPRPGSAPLRTSALLLLGYIGVLSHVAMDWLNNYGVRLLMPFSGRWFYGDAVFIVDPWLWLTLAAGVLLARRARRHTDGCDRGCDGHGLYRRDGHLGACGASLRDGVVDRASGEPAGEVDGRARADHPVSQDGNPGRR